MIERQQDAKINDDDIRGMFGPHAVPQKKTRSRHRVDQMVQVQHINGKTKYVLLTTVNNGPSVAIQITKAVADALKLGGMNHGS